MPLCNYDDHGDAVDGDTCSDDKSDDKNVNSDDDDRDDDVLDDTDDLTEKNESIFKGKWMPSKPTDVVLRSTRVKKIRVSFILRTRKIYKSSTFIPCQFFKINYKVYIFNYC